LLSLLIIITLFIAFFKIKDIYDVIPKFPMYYNYHMIEINIPGRGLLQLNHLVCDVNGTLAMDGNLIPGVARNLTKLRDRLTLHLLTADTYKKQDEIDRILNIQSVRLKPGEGAAEKAAYIRNLRAEHVAAIGQGANDAQMLSAAALGICILSREGLSTAALNSADILVPDIHSALELLEIPLRIVATLRK
jgi:soluble P-type ATPase